ncbi:MAG: hypothetical protein K9J13_03535 [Saprospiraceae bacterium]|nr:hypothetical protein [Saprospiraceae bacterium]
MVNTIIKNVQDPDYTKQISEASKIFLPIVDYDYNPKGVDVEGLENIVFELENVFYFDIRTTSIENIKRLRNDSLLISQDVIIKKLVKLGKMIFHKPFFVFCILLCIGLAFYEKKYIYPVFFGIVYFLGVLFALTVLKKMEYRLLIPIMTIMLVFLLIVLRDSIKNFISKNALFYKVVVFTIIFIFLFQSKLYYDSISQLNDQQLNSFALTREDLPDKKIFLLSDPFLNFNPLKHQTNISKALLIPIIGWSAYNEASYNFQLREFGTNDICDIFKSISASKDFLFLGTAPEIIKLNKILNMNGIDRGFTMEQQLDEGVTFLYSFKMNQE